MEWTGCSTYSLHDSHSTPVVTGEWEERETGKERWMGAVAQRVKALPPAQPECALWDSHGGRREQPPAVVFWLHTDAEMVCTHTSHGLMCVQMHTCTHMHTEKQTKAWILLGRRGECWFRQPVLLPGFPGKIFDGFSNTHLHTTLLSWATGGFKVNRPAAIMHVGSGQGAMQGHPMSHHHLLAPVLFSLSVRKPLCFNHKVFLLQSLEAQQPQKSTSLN